MKLEITENSGRVLVSILESVYQMHSVVWQELYRTGQDIRNRAIMSMRQTPKTGHTYTWQEVPFGLHDGFTTINGKTFPTRERAQPHIASSPGNPPAIDSGELEGRMFADGRKNEIEVGVLAGAPYAETLESSEGLNRPFLMPAVDLETKNLERRLIDAILRNLGDAT